MFKCDSKATKLNNICLPKIVSDFDSNRFKPQCLTPSVKAIEYDVASSEMNPSDDMDANTNDVENLVVELEFASVVDEQEFKDKFLPETHLQDVAVNFISVGKIEAKQEKKDFEKLDQEFPSVEDMITMVFPQLIASESGRLVLP